MAPWMALFPPGKGGGEGVAHGGKGKGILIHSLTEGNGMPLANRTTPANGDERAQVVPLLDAVKVRTGKRGPPVNVSRSSRRIKAMMRKRCVRRYGSGVSEPSSRSASEKPRKTVADRSKKRFRGSQPRGRLPGSRRNIVVWLYGGSVLLHALRHFQRSPRSRSGSVDS
jgi:hypothetical protein